MSRRAPGRERSPVLDGRWPSILAVAAPATLALVLAGRMSVTWPLWRDEFATRQYAALDLGGLVSATSHVDAVIAPYYAFVHLFSGLTGLGAGMRIWSVLAFGAAVAIVAALALRWWGRVAAVVAGTMLALNASVLSQAANARPYALALAGIALATILLDGALRQRPRRRGAALALWAGYAAAAVFTALMQPFAATALVVTAVLVRSRGGLLRWVLASAPWALAALLLLWRARSQSGQIEWVAPIDTDLVLSSLAKAAGMTGREFPAPAVMVALVAVAAVLAVVLSTRRREALFAAALVVVPVALLVVLSLLVQPAVSWRYLLWTSLGVALLAGAAVGRARVGRGAPGSGPRPLPRLARVVAVSVVAALLLGTGWHAAAVATGRPPVRDDFPGAVARMQEDARVGDLLVVVQRYGQGGVALGFALSAGDDAFVQEIEDASPRGPRPPLALRVITGTDPLRTAPAEDPMPTAAPGRSLWLVGVSSPRREDPSVLPAAVAACFGQASETTRIDLRSTRLYRIPCG